ncbi:pentatricopeptide repeat-containing protein At3g25210, mitochondrial [Mercurialis annua]|uniref:pentatricopeptide repeat-containing protein At3g25210, mitochondrial n=1 Tax=Mercurialis annua TaxID=3986 RepID=UPI00215EC9BB|nr:pentatricopeptide repeat-containing protein At3g25210, mitochondrial [Mercurialis annua]
MTPVTFRRLLTSTFHNSKPLRSPPSPLCLRFISSSPNTQNPQLSPAEHSPNLPIRTRTKTPLETQFETWTQNLKPGFTPADVTTALRAQSDPDLAFDIFRWTAQQRNYKHSHLTYFTIIKILTDGKRFRHAETLVEEVIAGACEMDVHLFNSMIRFCCSRKLLFNRAFDVYKKMAKSDDCKPTLESYAMLLNALLRRFNKLHVCYVYLHAVKSLTKQMKAFGVIPDTYTLNMIIKAFSMCREVDEAIRVFREMGLYGCEPNAYTYGYIVKGLCEKGRVGQGLGFYKEMKKKELVPSGGVYMVLVCSLAMDLKFGEAIEIVFDMLGNSMSPDLLTYKTVLEGFCGEGKSDEAFELLEEFRKRDLLMSQKSYKTLLNALHFGNRD